MQATLFDAMRERASCFLQEAMAGQNEATSARLVALSAGTRGPVTPRIVIARFRAKRSAVPFIPAEAADLLNVSEGS